MKNNAFALSKKISIAYYIVGIIALVVILATTIFAGYVEQNDSIMFSVTSGNESELTSINLTNFVPGQEHRQQVVISNNSAVPVVCEITFSETEDSELAPFIELKIVNDGATVYSASMTDILGKSIALDGVSGKGEHKYCIVYSMPETAENNAMSKSVEFDIEIACNVVG